MNYEKTNYRKMKKPKGEIKMTKKYQDKLNNLIKVYGKNESILAITKVKNEMKKMFPTFSN